MTAPTFDHSTYNRFRGQGHSAQWALALARADFRLTFHELDMGDDRFTGIVSWDYDEPGPDDVELTDDELKRLHSIYVNLAVFPADSPYEGDPIVMGAIGDCQFLLDDEHVDPFWKAHDTVLYALAEYLIPEADAGMAEHLASVERERAERRFWEERDTMTVRCGGRIAR